MASDPTLPEARLPGDLKRKVKSNVGLVSSIRADLENVINDFIENEEFSFMAYKQAWSNRRMSLLHQCCPLAYDPKHQIQIGFEILLDILKEEQEKSDLLTDISFKSIDAKKFKRQIACIFSIYCLFKTQLFSPPELVRIDVNSMMTLLRFSETVKLWKSCGDEVRALLSKMINEEDIFIPSAYAGPGFLNRAVKLSKQKLKAKCKLEESSAIDTLQVEHEHSEVEVCDPIESLKSAVESYEVETLLKNYFDAQKKLSCNQPFAHDNQSIVEPTMKSIASILNKRTVNSVSSESVLLDESQGKTNKNHSTKLVLTSFWAKPFSNLPAHIQESISDILTDKSMDKSIYNNKLISWNGMPTEGLEPRNSSSVARTGADIVQEPYIEPRIRRLLQIREMQTHQNISDNECVSSNIKRHKPNLECSRTSINKILSDDEMLDELSDGSSF